jgi:hypothetical protein
VIAGLLADIRTLLCGVLCHAVPCRAVVQDCCVWCLPRVCLRKCCWQLGKHWQQLQVGCSNVVTTSLIGPAALASDEGNVGLVTSHGTAPCERGGGMEVRRGGSGKNVSPQLTRRVVPSHRENPTGRTCEWRGTGLRLWLQHIMQQTSICQEGGAPSSITTCQHALCLQATSISLSQATCCGRRTTPSPTA